MPSENKTANIGLNQWQANEYPKREDFNADNLAIDEALDEKISKIGDGKDVTVTFDEATTRTNIGTGQKLSVLFGKIKKWLSDLKAVAFTGSYVNLDDKPNDENLDVCEDTKTALGLTQHDPQVKDALAKLLELTIGIDNYAFIVTVVNSDGMPLSNVNIDGLKPIFADTATTNKNGMAIGISNTKDLTLSIADYIDIPNSSLIVNATTQVTNVIFTVQKYTNNYRQITSSGNYKISSNIKTLDVCLVGAGAGGDDDVFRGRGGGGGYVTNVLNINNPKTANITIGSGGKGQKFNPEIPASNGGHTKFNNYIAKGGKKPADDNSGNGGLGNGNGGKCTQAGSPGTVHEFNDSSRQLFSGGGGGYNSSGQFDPGRNYPGGSPYGGSGSHNATGFGGGGGGNGGDGYQGVVTVRWRYE